MPKDICAHTRKIEKVISLSWKIDDFLDVISLYDSCIAGPYVTIPTQPKTTWRSFIVEYNHAKFSNYMFKLEPRIHCEFEKKIKTEFELSFLDTDGTVLRMEKGTLCINGCQSAKSIQFACAIEGVDSMLDISKLLVNNDLNMKCCFRVIEYSNDYPESYPVSSANDLNNLSNNLGTLLSSKLLSDFIVIVKGEVFHAHKCILASRSRVFGAMFKCHTLESRNNVLIVQDFDVSTMETLFSYIYTDQLGELPLEKYLTLYSASDKYEVESLKKTCAVKLINGISLDNVFEIYILGYYHSDPALKSAAITYMKENISSILASKAWAVLITENSEVASEMLKEAGIF